MIEIRADFQRHGFCLWRNGEPIGVLFHKYKHAVLAKLWLESEGLT